MQNEIWSLDAEWYEFFFDLTVVAGDHAFQLSNGEWTRISTETARSGTKFENFEAAKERFRLIWHGVDPTVAAAYAVRGVAPPRPAKIRRVVLIEQVQVIGGQNTFEGNIFLEMDNGWMKPVDGKELAKLAEQVPNLKNWRLYGRDD